MVKDNLFKVMLVMHILQVMQVKLIPSRSVMLSHGGHLCSSCSNPAGHAYPWALHILQVMHVLGRVNWLNIYLNDVW